MYSDGKLSGAERAHLEIVGQIIETRINVYENSKNTLLEIFGAIK